MAPEAGDPVLGLVLLVLGVASVAVWFALANRLSQGPILVYEPRRPVPWHGIWTLLPIGIVVLTLSTALTPDGPSNNEESVAAAGEMVENIASASAMQTALVLALLTVMVILSEATLTDLGFPKNAAELTRDIRIGVIAWLACIAPVYATQIALTMMFGPTEGHLLLNVVQEKPDLLTFLVAFVVAVVLAPICEEPLFRILLQGSLEKLEDRLIGWRTVPVEVVDDELVVPLEVAETTLAEEATSIPPVQLEPPNVGAFGLPFGWLPILVSALLFGLAHFGYGPEPIPLFLLGLIFGYVYQRTHRIVPTLVAHALFNGMSLFMLWRFVQAGGE
jgi:membrane protease YdiL (CAAX protease family)